MKSSQSGNASAMEIRRTKGNLSIFSVLGELLQWQTRNRNFAMQ